MLTDMTCKVAKAKSKSYKLSDGGGLYLEVLPSGVKSWRMKYRIFDKESRMTFGLYPRVGLQDARAKREQIKVELSTGRDPALIKLQAKQTATFNQAQTFELIAIEWQGKNKSYWSERYAKTVSHRFEKYVFPEIGGYPISQLTPKIVLACRGATG